MSSFIELVDVRKTYGSGAAAVHAIDGISFTPTLLGRKQEPRPFLYRESPGYGGQQCVRVGDWKAIRRNLNPGPKAAGVAGEPGEVFDHPSSPRLQRFLSQVL